MTFKEIRAMKLTEIRKIAKAYQKRLDPIGMG